jgi:cytochrome c553
MSPAPGESVIHARVALVLLALVLGSAAAAQERPNGSPAPRQHSGYPAYYRYCAACHGTDGSGNGPVANVLHPRPSDLRRLYVRFPPPFDSALREYIDGRNMPRAHGGSDMPVWGERLHDDVSPSLRRELAVLGTLTLILDYLESIQLNREPT